MLDGSTFPKSSPFDFQEIRIDWEENGWGLFFEFQQDSGRARYIEQFWSSRALIPTVEKSACFTGDIVI